MPISIDDKRKSLGFDCLVYLISVFIVSFSYWYTVKNITMQNVIESGYLEYIKTSYVFLSPCAIEAINFLVTEKKKHLDAFEKHMGEASIVISAILLVMAFSGIKISECGAKILTAVLVIYPVKYAVLLFNSYKILNNFNGR